MEFKYVSQSETRFNVTAANGTVVRVRLTYLQPGAALLRFENINPAAFVVRASNAEGGWEDVNLAFGDDDDQFFYTVATTNYQVLFNGFHLFALKSVATHHIEARGGAVLEDA